MTTFGELVRDARLAAGWTQDALSEQTGISRSTLIRWESGQGVSPDAALVRIACKALNIPPVRAAMALGFLESADLSGDVHYEPMIQEALDTFGQLSSDEQQQVLRFAAFLRADSSKG